MSVHHKRRLLVAGAAGAAAVLAVTGILVWLAAADHGGHRPPTSREIAGQRTVIGASEEGNPPGFVATRPTTTDPDAGLPSDPTNDLKGVAATFADQPCRLVTRSEAEGILGASIVVPRQAPLGPSCVYVDGASTISLSVESFSFGSVSARLKGVQEGTVAGRPVYCGTLGQPLLFAPIDPSATLEIVAPCPVARGFAGAALPRLTNA